jgi:hypothetical protein
MDKSAKQWDLETVVTEAPFERHMGGVLCMALGI